MKHTFTVKGMHCNACAMLVREALEEAGAKNISVTVDTKKQQGTVTAESSKTKQALAKAIEAEGAYTVQ
jgi:copper chaperone CopZ